jgi:hypothetical protein
MSVDAFGSRCCGIMLGGTALLALVHAAPIANAQDQQPATPPPAQTQTPQEPPAPSPSPPAPSVQAPSTPAPTLSTPAPTPSTPLQAIGRGTQLPQINIRAHSPKQRSRLARRAALARWQSWPRSRVTRRSPRSPGAATDACSVGQRKTSAERQTH